MADVSSNRRHYEKLRADPVRWAAYKAKKRAAYISSPEVAERSRARSREWKRQNREKVRAHKRANHERHRETANAKRRQHYMAHREDTLRLQREERMDPAKKDILRDRRRRNLAAQIARDPEGYREHRRAYSAANRVAQHLSGVKKSAKQKGVGFDLDLEWFQERIDAGLCEMSGLPFAITGKRNRNSPSVDRRDPKGPYTKANCRMILWWLNRALSDSGEDYALGVFRAVLARSGGS